MRKQLTRILALSVLTCFLGIGNAWAQQSDSVTVVSFWQCDGDQLDEAAEMFKNENGPHLNKLVDEGKLTSWGTLTHLWGDEWNFVAYYNAEDIGTFHDAFGDFISTVMEENPDMLSKWTEMCDEHKDNIYSQGYNYSGGEGGSEGE